MLAGAILGLIGSAPLLSLTEAKGDAAVTIRGLDPALLPRYTSNATHFHCLGDSRAIPFSAVNDEYCDCDDGSDEPGTSACEDRSTGFYCANVGHIPGIVLASRVNDGLCDEECCDGTDEWATGACPDRCDKIGMEYRAKVEAEAKTRKTGAKIRGTYIKHAQAERKRLQDELQKKQAEVAGKEQEVEKLRVNLEGLEAKSHETLVKRKESSIYATLTAQRTLLARLRAQEKSVRKQLDDLRDVMEELQRSHNPNGQDMALKAALVGFKELTEGATSGDDIAETDKVDKVDPVSEWELDQAERKDLEALILEDLDGEESEADDATSLLYRIDNYVPDFLFERFDALRDVLVEWLPMLGISGKTTKASSGAGDAPHVAAARQKHNDATNDLHRLRRDISDTEGTLSKLSGTHFGMDGEWKKLDGTCIDKISGDYTYELCFFGSATQKSNKDYSSNHLGSFSDWNEDEEPGSYPYYTQQAYRNGGHCWNGPQRSVDVELSCGLKNELLHVAEPEKCMYLFKATTPALCWPLEITMGEGSGKENLGSREEL